MPHFVYTRYGICSRRAHASIAIIGATLPGRRSAPQHCWWWCINKILSRLARVDDYSLVDAAFTHDAYSQECELYTSRWGCFMARRHLFPRDDYRYENSIDKFLRRIARDREFTCKILMLFPLYIAYIIISWDRPGNAISFFPPHVSLTYASLPLTYSILEVFGFCSLTHLPQIRHYILTDEQ